MPNPKTSPSPQDVSGYRRGAHRFLRQHAALAWQFFSHDDKDSQPTLPPEIAALPKPQRFNRHAETEAQRIAAADLYNLCPRTTNRAVYLGAAIREDYHQHAVARAGEPKVAATMGITPPTATGLLRWQGGIGYNQLGAPIVACHWGPAADGVWLGWWADSRHVAEAYAAKAGENSAFAKMLRDNVLPIFGPLWYDQQELLTPNDSGSVPTSIPRTRRPGYGPGPYDSVPIPTPARNDTPTGVNWDHLSLIYTTLASWHLLTGNDTATRLRRVPPTRAEQTATRAAGLPPRPITTATTRKDTHS